MSQTHALSSQTLTMPMCLSQRPNQPEPNTVALVLEALDWDTAAPAGDRLPLAVLVLHWRSLSIVGSLRPFRMQQLVHVAPSIPGARFRYNVYVFGECLLNVLVGQHACGFDSVYGGTIAYKPIARAMT